MIDLGLSVILLLLTFGYSTFSYSTMGLLLLTFGFFALQLFHVQLVDLGLFDLQLFEKRVQVNQEIIYLTRDIYIPSGEYVQDSHPYKYCMYLLYKYRRFTDAMYIHQRVATDGSKAGQEFRMHIPASCGTPCGGGHAAGEAGVVDVGVVEGDQGAAAAASRPRGSVHGSCNRNTVLIG
jgi:hypothetical protein